MPPLPAPKRTAMNLAAVEIKAFVPARELVRSMASYTMLGFEIPWSSDALAYVRRGGTRFLLQPFFVAEHAGNFMMLLVENADDWHRHVRESGVIEHFQTRVGEIADPPWDMRDFTLVDPACVLWRIGHNL